MCIALPLQAEVGYFYYSNLGHCYMVIMKFCNMSMVEILTGGTIVRDRLMIDHNLEALSALLGIYQ